MFLLPSEKPAANNQYIFSGPRKCSAAAMNLAISLSLLNPFYLVQLQFGWIHILIIECP